jgi:hypothetical protein
MKSIHTLIRTTSTFIYPQYRVLFGNKFLTLMSFSVTTNTASVAYWLVLSLSAVNRGFEPRSGHTKDYKMAICCFSAKHTALRRKSTDWLARNQNNVSEWSDMSTRGLLFQRASTIKIQLCVSV